MSTTADILGPDGALAGRLPGFVPRPGQQQLTARIEAVLARGGVFVAESGTGTGKTFAYLVPALLSGKKVLISTGTKHLQDQLYHRDLPLIREAVGAPVSAALLKGRANYLCLYRLERAELDRRFAGARPGGPSRRELGRVRAWAQRTTAGDIGELADVAEDAEVWPLVTSTADNCLGSTCPDYGRCFVNRARKEALAADVVVVNHHLFFADLALREEGFGQLLPGVDAVVFDEAHQLPEIASHFFGVNLTSHQLLGLARDTQAEALKVPGLGSGLPAAAGALEKAVAEFRLALGVQPRRESWSAAAGGRGFADRTDDCMDAGGRATQGAVAEARAAGQGGPDRGFAEALAGLNAALGGLAAALESAAPASQGLTQCWRRALDLAERADGLSDDPPPQTVRWLETTAHGFMLHLTPLDVAAPFRPYLAQADKAWVFTSATLAIDQRFDHFLGQLGLEQAQTGLWDSPFDYASQALLYIPRDLPDPARPEFTDRVLEAALPVLRASRGRAFLLFTSHRALRRAAERLSAACDYPLLVQGSAPRSELLARFRAAGNAVLLGTGSFWEGVDVRGEALSCVIIDKLPFASPDDPVFRARGEAMSAAGRNPFWEHQLPQAVIALKQGAGRLIRDAEDRGVLVLCDPRLLSKGYGKLFLHSLPPMPLTRELADVQRFFAAAPAADAGG